MYYTKTKMIVATFARLGAVVATALMPALGGHDSAAAQTVKVGVIMTYSGRDAALGCSHLYLLAR